MKLFFLEVIIHLYGKVSKHYFVLRNVCLQYALVWKISECTGLGHQIFSEYKICHTHNTDYQ